MKEVCQIKEVITREENFWEREIYYIIRSYGVYTFFNKIKHFLFQLKIWMNIYKKITVKCFNSPLILIYIIFKFLLSVSVLVTILVKQDHHKFMLK